MSRPVYAELLSIFLLAHIVGNEVISGGLAPRLLMNKSMLMIELVNIEWLHEIRTRFLSTFTELFEFRLMGSQLGLQIKLKRAR